LGARPAVGGDSSRSHFWGRVAVWSLEGVGQRGPAWRSGRLTPSNLILIARVIAQCLIARFRSLRCSPGCRRLRRRWRNGKALFRQLLLQIGGANIGNPPTSSSLAEERTPPLAPPQHGGARFSDARNRGLQAYTHFDGVLEGLAQRTPLGGPRARAHAGVGSHA
jgi:hypothetical protein